MVKSPYISFNYVNSIRFSLKKELEFPTTKCFGNHDKTKFYHRCSKHYQTLNVIIVADTHLIFVRQLRGDLCEIEKQCGNRHQVIYELLFQGSKVGVLSEAYIRKVVRILLNGMDSAKLDHLHRARMYISRVTGERTEKEGLMDVGDVTISEVI